MSTLKLSAPLVVVLLLVAAAATKAVPEPIRAAMHFTLNDATTRWLAADAATPAIEYYQSYAMPADLTNMILTPGASEARCSGGANGGADPTGNECTTPGELI